MFRLLRAYSAFLLVIQAYARFINDAASTSGDFVDFVNPFIGTTNGGHVFPGATLPHGMAKLGMDTDSPGNQAGYDADPQYNATGFSALHDTGTGGGVSLSNFKIWPLTWCSSFNECQTSIDGRKALRKVLSDGSPDDAASPGYFASNLSTGVRVELTTTRRTALHRYTFPSSVENPRMIVDITNDGQQSAVNPFMTMDPTTGRVTGGANFASSFGPGRYIVYSCTDFKAPGPPAQYGAWLGNYPVQNTTTFTQIYSGSSTEMGALLEFPAGNATSSSTEIIVRVGVSFISTEQACANAEEESPDFDFDGVHATNRATWNELLGRIQVNSTGVAAETVELLYSSIYRTHISPADYTGENPNWNSTEPYYDSLYCNWDTFRTLYPLFSLHDPENFALIVRGMINIQQHEGWLPECRGATLQQWIQGGTNADPILGEFAVKFNEQASALNVSLTDLYTALLADAELQAPDWNLQGKQIHAWEKYNFIPQDSYEAGGAPSKWVSRSLEYAFDDFAVSQVAKVLGNSSAAAKYATRAMNYVNVWNPNTTVPGNSSIKGMMQPRFSNGTFNYTDPRHCSIHDPTQSTCYLNAWNRDGFYESSPLVYSQFVPQDVANLIKLQGGNDAFLARLEFLIDQHYFDVTDEPSMNIPFMYHYANKPGLSTQTSRQLIAQYFNTSVNGIPGNDDSGAMASWAAFYLLGMYPVPSTTEYLLASSWFPEVSFYIPALNKTTTIKANGFEGNPASGTGGKVFVSNVTVNGEAYKSNCYLDWDVFTNGSTVELTLTDDINVSCGGGKFALPSSLSTGGFSA